MPPELECPFCAEIVPDWHFEWHSRQDQADIIAGRKTMECPLCRAGVAFDGFDLTTAGDDRPTAVRDIEQAARWARNQSSTLAHYVQTREGMPFANIWRTL